MDVLIVAARRTTIVAALVAALPAWCAAGCGSFAAPVQFSSQSSAQEGTTPERGLAVRPVEGRPDGLVLELAVDFEPEPQSRLTVQRRMGSDAVKTLRTIELDAARARHARKKGIEFIDRSVEPGAPLHYRIAYYAAGRSPADDPPDRHSEVRTVEWSDPPPRPDRVSARADTPRAVELRWKPGGTGALIFRRDVLDRSGGPKRIAALGAGRRGVLLDRSVRPGGVYAYRVALAVEHDDYTQYGPPSESLYVSVPED